MVKTRKMRDKFRTPLAHTGWFRNEFHAGPARRPKSVRSPAGTAMLALELWERRLQRCPTVPVPARLRLECVTLQQAVSLEHLLNTAQCLLRALFVFDESEPHMIVPKFTKAHPGTDGDLGIGKKFFGELE